MRFNSPPWWIFVALVWMAWGIHATAIGVSYATVVPPALCALAAGKARRWTWRKPAGALAIGIVLGLAVIFAVETCLGFISVRWGPLYPPERMPVGPEPLIIRFLGWLYGFQAGDKLLAVSIALSLVATLADIAVDWWVSAANRVKDFFERAMRSIECAGIAVATLLLLTFANAVDLKTTGLNVFAANYQAQVAALGSNASAVAALGRQVDNLKAMDRALRDVPPAGAAKDLIDATAELIRLYGQLDRATVERDAIDELPPAPSRIALDDGAASTLPGQGQLEAPPPPGDPDPVMRLIAEAGQLTSLERQVSEAVARRAALQAERTQLLTGASGTLRVSLHRATDLPDLPGQLEAQLSERIAVLVASKGLDAAIAELRLVRDRLRAEVAARERANAARAREKAAYRRQLETYRTQQKACVEIAAAVGQYLRNDPQGSVLAERLKQLGSGKAEFGSKFDPAPYRLAAAPRWSTGPAEANQRLHRKFDDEVTSGLYGAPGVPAWALEGHGAAIRKEFASVGGNLESAGFALLRRWVESLCVDNASPQVIEAELRRLSDMLPG